jgi:hypothetical protein
MKNTYLKITIIYSTLVIMLFTILFNLYFEEYEVKVKEKIVKALPGGEVQTYLVVTDNNRVFVIKDQPVFLKFNSTDMYAALTDGETYIVRTTGFRFRPLSKFENIISYKCTSSSSG